ncbi:ATP-binding protein [Photobacterium rosenbergii]|uniref:ATP-binding protein n=1 Tax=Photobacterium rosenbergii TaxID=294936 RepID=UPI001C99AB5B|nr:ATP-binding protein [Photobacterium rosenbergii]MBY5946011.1 ATP-binding protein [Photobacterium rosenbergii]
MKSSVLAKYRNDVQLGFKATKVEHPHYKLAKECLVKAIGFSGTEQFESVAISGPTGVGKSTLCRAFRDEVNSLVPPNSDELPVIVITAKVVTTPKSFFSALLHELGDIEPTKGTTEDMRIRLRILLEGRGVLMIIIDEFQDLFQEYTGDKAFKTAMFYKGFMKETLIPVVIAGTESVEHVLQVEDQFHRLYNLYRLPGFSIDTQQETEYYQYFVNKLMKRSPVPSSVSFEGKMLERLFLATNGSMALLKKLVTEAIHVAQKRNCMELTKESFADAFSSYFKLRETQLGINPFLATNQQLNRKLKRGVI